MLLGSRGFPRNRKPGCIGSAQKADLSLFDGRSAGVDAATEAAMVDVLHDLST